MMRPMFRSAAVLGAGTMGAQIAAHLANAGVPVLLLDITADAARDGLKRARALKPDPFFTAEAISLIETSFGLEVDSQLLAFFSRCSQTRVENEVPWCFNRKDR